MSSSKVTDGSERFPCPHHDCGRSFARKEHLSRHALSHSDARYVCNVCGRGFTRSDSLQRHLARHGDAFKQSPSGRSKRACIACHASKTKCDGNESCSKCVKKGIDCIYEQQETIHQEEPPTENLSQLQQEPSSQVPASEVAPSMLPPNLEPEEPNGTVSTCSIDISMSGVGSSNPISVASETTAETIAPENRMNWVLYSRIEKDLGFPDVPSAQAGDVPMPLPLDSFRKKCHDLYFLHFHHRWTIFNRPTYDPCDLNILSGSVLLIGAWLEGSLEAKEYAIKSHIGLMDDILIKLSRITSKDVFRQSLPTNLCQAALLNIIFGMYCGKDTILSRAIIVKSTLIGALREVGLFTPGIPYDKPGHFLPYRNLNIGDRSRLAAYLYKIDSYLNILRSHPASLIPEELQHYPQPSTYSLYNADGLDILDSRLSIEPSGRASRYLHRVLISPLIDVGREIEDGLMLVEDIQLGLCAMYCRIFDFSDRLRHSLDINNAIQRDVLQRHLGFWKDSLAKTSYFLSKPASFSREMQLSIRFYYGFEDHSRKSEWESIVFARARDLYFDAIMLYHLSCLNFYADIRSLRQTARDLVPDSLAAEYGEPYRQAQQKRKSNLREFTRTHNMRRVLCHSSSILNCFSSLSPSEKKVVDPISYVALSTAALVTWAYCSYGDQACDLCLKSGGLCGVPVVNISKFSDMMKEESERDTWIENGGGLVALDGVPFCLCVREVFAKRFQDELPDGWDGADSISPGIFQQRR